MEILFLIWCVLSFVSITALGIVVVYEYFQEKNKK